MSHLKTLVIDNGSDRIKWGYAGKPDTYRSHGNYVAKVKGDRKNYVGDVETARSQAGVWFRRPHDRGYPINWDAQKEIWDYALGEFDAREFQLLLTEPIFNPNSVRKVQAEIIFEDYAFDALYTASAPFFSAFQGKKAGITENFAKSPCHLVVDCGFSFTHVVPFFDLQKINYGIKRIDVGGRFLTNAMKEAISFRQLNLLEETYLTNLIKEKCCYVPIDFYKELQVCKKKGPLNTVAVDYVLPDYVNHNVGYILEDKASLSAEERAKMQILRLNNERISIPEILFNPKNEGINQAGIAETIIQSVESCHPDMHAALYNNILLTGGSACFRGFRDRVELELRSVVSSRYQVNVSIPEDPVRYAWDGASNFPEAVDWSKCVVTRKDYEETGSLYCLRKLYN
ncbi:actin-related protein 6-like [Planoprotostelium fungivorum]|uniref:Actin-related protein 6-like n=1 Tax=Planoprotostelium fungivorum TaxID=1890364 RepID=A0A2P6NYY4_9EUKA|nr:actin-related protein 6-like [Planoprotostelium fungivorum]